MYVCKLAEMAGCVSSSWFQNFYCQMKAHGRWFSHSTNCIKSVMVESQVFVEAWFKTVPVIAMLLLLAIFLTQLGTPAGDKEKVTANMRLDLEKNCTWTRKPGKGSMPEHPTFESDHVPGCFQYCFGEAGLKWHGGYVGSLRAHSFL